jgi:alpha-L-fucosidase
VEAVYTSKRGEDCADRHLRAGPRAGRGRGHPAQPLADRYLYRQLALRQRPFSRKYKTPKVVIDMLVDIVSRNGNLMLNFPLPNSAARWMPRS